MVIGSRKKKKAKNKYIKNSGLPKFLHWSHALRPDQLFISTHNREPESLLFKPCLIEAMVEQNLRLGLTIKGQLIQLKEILD